MAKQHALRFLQLVTEAKTHVRECDVHEVKQRLDARKYQNYYQHYHQLIHYYSQHDYYSH